VSNFSQTLNYIASSFSLGRNTKVFTYDESRFGLLLIQRRKITLKGIKPISHFQHEFENYYLYGAVEPITGEHFFLELPSLDTACFQAYLDEFSKAYEDSFNIILLDRGSFHRAKSLRLPHNIAFILLPPYSPELSPIERVWESFKEDIANEVHKHIDSLKDRVASIVCGYSDSTFSSLTSYSYFINAVNDVFQ
jgi:hypothetical protein